MHGELQPTHRSNTQRTNIADYRAQASSQEMVQDRRGTMVNSEIDPSLSIRNHALYWPMVVSIYDGLAEVDTRVGLGGCVFRDHSPSPPNIFL